MPATLPHPLEPAGGEPTVDPFADLETIEAQAHPGQPEHAPTAAAAADRSPEGQPVAAGGPEAPAEALSAVPADDVTAEAPTAEQPTAEQPTAEPPVATVLADPPAPDGGRETSNGAVAQPRRATRPVRHPRPSPRAGEDSSPVPDRYLEVQIEPVALAWDDRPVDPITKAPEPDGRQLRVLSVLHRLGPLLSSQIEREFYTRVSDRTVQRSLAAMRRAGWVRRFRLREAHGRGQPRYVYVLDKRGFDVAREHTGPKGPWIPRDAKWVDRRYDSVLKPLHDLHANALLFALQAHLGQAMRGWKGPGEGLLHPPRKRERGGEYRPLRPDELPLESPLRLSGLQIDGFETLKPDLTLELLLQTRTGPRRFDLLVELDRSSNPRSDSNTRKLLRYDALLTGWHVALDRYRTLGQAPFCVVACQDESAARRWATVADELLTGRIQRLGDPDTEAAFHGRRRILFATELDLHRGLMRGYRVPERPRELRQHLAGRRETDGPALELVTFLPVQALGSPA